MSSRGVEQRTPLTFRSDIEGLRGVAVLLVVAFHVGIDRLLARFNVDVGGGGFVGVDVFYVISGFLITSLLLRELQGTGGINLRRFWARRVRRLLPSASLVIVVTLAASWVLLPAIDRAEMARDAVASATYVSNVWFAMQATDYFQSAGSESPFLHYWSLSLEEQYYVVWPLLISAVAAGVVGARLTKRVGITVGAVLACSFGASVVLTTTSAPWAFFGLPTRAWELAAGAALAIWGTRPSQRLAWAGSATGLALILGAALLIDPLMPFPGWLAIVPVVGTVLILWAGLGPYRTPVARMLSIGPLRYVGRVSYVWYLWHWPFIVLAGPAVGALNRPTASVVVAAAGLSFLAAAATHHLVEAPLHRSAWLGRGWRPAIALAGSAAAVGLLAGPTIAASSSATAEATTAEGARLDRVRQADGCGLGFTETVPTSCEFGMKGGELTVALLGDSHAEHLLPALERAAQQRRWRLLLYTKASCPPVDVARWLDGYNREYHECQKWRDAAFEDLVERQTDIVVLSRFGGYGDDLLTPEGTRATAEQAADAWRQGARRTFQRLRSSDIDVVMMRDTPSPGFDVPRCLSASAEDPLACSYERAGHVHWDQPLYEAEVQAARTVSAVEFIDLSQHVCDSDPCRVRDADGTIKFRDGNHLTATYSSRLAEPLLDALSATDLMQ